MATLTSGPGRVEQDLPALTVLALLTQGPRHPYDIHRFIVETHKDFVRGAPRSIYHAVRRLHDAHLIEPVGSEQHGGRPERTVYALTDAGTSEVRRRVSLLLSTPLSDRAITSAALSFLGVLSESHALTAVRARVAALDEALSGADDSLEQASGVPEFLLVESQYERDLLAAERDWFSRLADRLEAGRLPRPTSRSVGHVRAASAGRTAGA